MTQPHSSFVFNRQEHISALQLDAKLYTHEPTGAIHLHLDTGQKENAFMVAFRTMPMDSMGVAHILEHTALCGSKRFPVRDPFFMMTRRSLNTFMNAFTSSDWTAYPFATQNRKDFFNLLSVYLDAAFFARLDPLDFAQEGHRVELAEDEQSLVYKGVVYNEMKGAMAPPMSQLWQNVNRYLYPTTTYHYNSGGDPAVIPKLTYQQLVDFYQAHYHPSNAIFLTSGDIAVETLQDEIQAQALQHFAPRSMAHLKIADEQRYFAPVRVVENYASDEANTQNKSYTAMSWLLGSSINLYEKMQASLLSEVLLGNSASPLQKYLETSKLGSAPLSVSGLDDSSREMAFYCGISGSDASKAQAFEEDVLACLQDVVTEGIEPEVLEAALHQLELSTREIKGGRFPFGMQLMLSALPALIHHGDGLAALNLDSVIERLHQAITKPDFIPNLVQTLLLDNPHRVTYTMQPDGKVAQQQKNHETQQLAQHFNTLNEAAKEDIRKQTKALAKRQAQEDDDSLLPTVTLDDIPQDFVVPQAVTPMDEAVVYAEGTNGLAYHKVSLPWPQVTLDDLHYLALFTDLITELGLGKADYLQVQGRQAAVCGGISAYTSVQSYVSDANKLGGYLTVSVKGLVANQTALLSLIKDTLHDVRLDESQRIKELIKQMAEQAKNSISSSAHRLAMSCASQNMSNMAAYNYHYAGIAGYHKLQALSTSLDDDQGFKQLIKRLETYRQHLINAPKRCVSVVQEAHVDTTQALIQDQFGQELNVYDRHLNLSLPAKGTSPVQQLWFINSQVNFCARSYASVSSDHEDAPALSVLSEIIVNGFLHRAVREQGGAYGVFASQNNQAAYFAFASYRDPRHAETFADYSAAIDWVAQGAFTQQHLQEALFSIISIIDKPGTPAGEALSAYQNYLHGKDQSIQKDYRDRLLAVTREQVIQVVHTYLIDKPYSEVVVGSDTIKDDPYFVNFDKAYISD